MKYFKFYFVFALLVFASCKNEPKTATSTDTTQTESTENPIAPKPVENPVAEVDVPEGSGLTLKGKIPDMKGHPIVISKVGYIQTPPTVIAKGSTKEDGSFTVNMNPQKKGIYSLKIGNIESLFLLKGDEKSLVLNTTGKDFQEFNYALEGAPINKEYIKLMKGAFTKSFSLDQIKSKILNIKEPLVASLLAVQVLRDPGFVDVHKKIAAKMKKDPTIDEALYKKGYAGIITSMINFKKQQAAQAQAKTGGIQVGMQAPDLAFNDPTGKVRKLSDLKGKLVLLDFWASWCRPCRKANPNVVRIYKKYKDQGFTVFSVSLDGSKNGDAAEMERGRQKWINAIKKDGLEWPNHVSDLRSWNSAGAAKYGVQSIPATFLVGRDGKIVELEPGRKDLETIIKKNL